jgi:hypothetical protein
MSTTVTMTEMERPEFTPELDSLFSRYSRFVYSTAFVITGNAADAEDVLHFCGSRAELLLHLSTKTPDVISTRLQSMFPLM